MQEITLTLGRVSELQRSVLSVRHTRNVVMPRLEKASMA